MSAKWIRAKQWDDQHLVGWLSPVRVVLRAFSTIPLAVVLLSLVALYGILASIPIGLIAMAPTYLAYGATVLLSLALLGALPAWILARGLRATGLPRGGRFAVMLVAGICLTIASVVLWRVAVWPAVRFDPETGSGFRMFGTFVDQYKSMQFRRLPMMEMSELEFYSWWPLRVVLVLFVLNMVTTTVRRIEFRFPYLGVLTVHSGIVTIALGSIYYAALKQEGDMVLFAGEPAEDGTPTAGPPETGFYDNTDIALWVSQNPERGWEQRRLFGVPRYNDYNLNALGLTNLPPMARGDTPDRGPLNVVVPAGPPGSGADQRAVDPDVRFRVIGYASHADLIQQWVAKEPGNDAGGPGTAVRTVEAYLTVPSNPKDPSTLTPDEPKKTWRLLPDLPSERVDLLAVDGSDLLGIEYTRGDTGGRGMTEQRWSDLSRSLPRGTQHALVVRHRASGFEAVYPVQQGQRIAVGTTGFNIEVSKLLPSPPFPIITRGYQGAKSSVAVVRVDPPKPADGAAAAPSYERWVYHRFPEISQDLVDPPASSENKGSEKAMGGQRRIADPELDIHYIDASIVQIYFDERPDGTVRSLVRLPGGGATVTPSIKPGESVEAAPGLKLKLAGHLDNASLVEYPFSTPQARRETKAIGNHQRAAIAVEVSATPKGTDAAQSSWKTIVWIPFAQYARSQNSEMQRVVSLPDGRRLSLVFGRVRHEFWPPMGIRLADFEMIPYPHSQTPRDYRSELIVMRRWSERHEDVRRTTSLNEPLLERTPFQRREDVPAVVNAAAWALSKIAPNQYKFSQAGWDQSGWMESVAAVERGELKRPIARYTILGVGNNPGIYIIATGAVMMSVGIPWAFYVKPWLVRRQKKKFQERVARGEIKPRGRTIDNGKTGEAAALNGVASVGSAKHE